MIGVVLAGGASRRFGGRAKGLQIYGDKPLALHVAGLLSRVCDLVVIEAAVDAGYEALGLSCVYADVAHAGQGPLAGLVAGLNLARPDELVAFAPCDMPLLTVEIYQRLLTERMGAYAATRLGFEPLVSVLPGACFGGLRAQLSVAQIPPTHLALEANGARPILFQDQGSFCNVNTPEDLAELR